MEIREQIQKKFDTDAAFAAALKEAKSAQEAMKVLREAGFQVSLEDVMKMAKPDDMELPDELLETASGGGWLLHYPPAFK